MTRPCLLAILLSLHASACGEPDPEIRGLTNRVVGERLTVAQLAGAGTFTGVAQLEDNDLRNFYGSALATTLIDDRTLTLRVPRGVAAGSAVLWVERSVEGKWMSIRLLINRLAIAVDDQRNVVLLPLPPTTLPQVTLSAGSATATTARQIALSPSGGQLALTDDLALQAFALGAEPKVAFPGIQQQGTVALAALETGALVCTATQVLRYRVAADGSTSSTPRPLTDCRALAINDNGSEAYVLRVCDTAGDGKLEDCLTTLSVDDDLAILSTLAVDPTPSATLLSARQDGKGFVVADGDTIRGIFRDATGPVRPSAITLQGGGNAVAIARGESTLGDLFAVADGVNNQIRFVAFDPESQNALRDMKTAALPEKPTAISFGRGSELFVAAGNKLYRVDPTDPALAAQPVEVELARPLVKLLVQP